jgi:hypothetical protein
LRSTGNNKFLYLSILFILKSPSMQKTERFLIMLAFVAVALNISNVPGAGFLTVLALLFLALFYNFLSFALLNGVSTGGLFRMASYQEITTRQIVAAIFVGFGLAQTVIGILFTIQSYPADQFLLALGLFYLAVVAVVSSLIAYRAPSPLLRRIFNRVLLVGTAGFLAYFIG